MSPGGEQVGASTRLTQGPGPLSSFNIIGEVTEGLHKLLLDSYDLQEQPPRIEEDLKFVPKDREEVIYIYMYRVASNPNLQNTRRRRLAPVELPAPADEPDAEPMVFYQRPPLLMDLFYLVAVHSKFRSDAERLMGWVLMTLHENPLLLRRRRRFVLPDGRAVDSKGRDWQAATSPDDKDVHIERVSLALVDDLTIGDAVNLYTIHEAPYRPFLSFRGRVAMVGSMIAAGAGTEISTPRAVPFDRVPSPDEPGGRVSPNGRISSARSRPRPRRSNPPGPPARNIRPLSDEPPSRHASREPDSED